MIILIPLPLFFAQTIYSTAGLTTWVVVGIIWTFLSAFCVVLYPLYESRVAIGQIVRGLTKVCSLFSLSFRLTHFAAGYFLTGQWQIRGPSHESFMKVERFHDAIMGIMCIFEVFAYQCVD